jgi:topoisomerase IA-like protein
MRVLGPHPKDKRPVELHSGRYGPYVKHGDINATLPDRDAVASLSLDQALALLAEKAGKSPVRKPKRAAKSAGTAAKVPEPDPGVAAKSKPKTRTAGRAATTAKPPATRTARVSKTTAARKRSAK